MNPVTRGVRNAFRNVVRTLSIVVILGLSIGLSLTMLIAQKAVDDKIASVKSSIGNTISVSPAGFTPGSQANNALTATELKKLSTISHVTSVDEDLSDQLSTTGSSSSSTMPFGGSQTSSTSTTSLKSPTTLNTSGGSHFISGGNGSASIASFSLPISFLGTNDTSSIDSSAITVTSGKTISGSSDTDDVLISKAMATKNDLSVGSTFTAYNTTLTVAGIFTASTQSASNTVVMSLPALQRLSDQSGVVTSATVTVDSLDNLTSVTLAVKKDLGSSADVTSAEEEADDTIKPLNSVKTVSTFSLLGALAAGSIIILMIMIMVVRERKKEIGVAKAIGGSNLRIMSEFMIESLTLALLGAVVGLVIGIAAAQPMTKMLVSNSSSSSTTSQTGGPGAGGPGGMGGRSFTNNATVQGIDDVKAQVGFVTLLEGFGTAVLISVIGGALSAGMISRVRPSNVMRAD